MQMEPPVNPGDGHRPGGAGADSNKLVEITDDLSATSLPAGESFQTVRTAVLGQLYRGVSFTPGSH
jgi:hypothetical protein